jgi:hypothetical protein
MKKLLLSFLFIGSLGANAQTVLFEDNFDSYTNFAKASVGNWTLTDIDLRPTYGFGGGTTFTNSGTAMAYIVFNSTAVTPALVPSATSNWAARSGQKAMACIAAVPNATFPTNDDWLISPQITLAASENTVSFWAKSCDATYAAEEFQVFVSTSTTAVANFVALSAVEMTLFGVYNEYTYDLSAYNGQAVYIAIRCVSADQFGFMVDDFSVTTNALGVNESLANKFSTYPNPVDNVINVSNNYNVVLTDVNITDINGRIVKTLNVNNLSEVQMNVSDLNSGVYFMNINTDSGKVVKKFIKS